MDLREKEEEITDWNLNVSVLDLVVSFHEHGNGYSSSKIVGNNGITVTC
jgi:hypothetical protein